MTEPPYGMLNSDAADAAIDRAVREIMSSEPRPFFRERVLARLTADTPARWTWPRLGIPAAVALLVALVVWATVRDRYVDVDLTPQRAATERVEPDQSLPTAQPREGGSNAPAPVPDRRIPTRKIGRAAAPTRPMPAAANRTVAAASVSAADEALEREDSTPPQDPIAPQPIRIRPVETSEIIVKPMTIGPLLIVPLPPPR